jgi:hypothetical protein
VPQIINNSSDTEVYFRVSDVFRDVKVVVKAGDKVLISKKKQKLAPAEMEKVLLTKEMLEEASGETLSFSIE